MVLGSVLGVTAPTVSSGFTLEALKTTCKHSNIDTFFYGNNSSHSPASFTVMFNDVKMN